MKKLFVLTVMVMALFFSANAAYAVTLSFVDNGNGTVDIMADDSSQVLGAAFTVEYDSDILALTDVDSTYFGTFVQQFPELVNAADKKGMDASGNVDGFPAPIVENNLTGKVKIAAACHTANAANKKLFTLTFALKSGATSAPSTIRIVPTEMDSTAGGYAVGDKIDPLIGVSGETYPVLLTKETLANNPVELPNYEISTVDIDMNLAAGLNIFTYPVEVPDAFTSYQLIALLGGEGSVKKLMKWENGWKTNEYKLNPFSGVTELSGNAFDIVNGKGYLLYMDIAKVHTFSGMLSSAPTDLAAGMNISSFPNPPAGLTSYQLLVQLGGSTDVIKLMKWENGWKTNEYKLNPFSGTIELSGNSYDITNEEAYLLYMNTAKTGFRPTE